MSLESEILPEISFHKQLSKTFQADWDANNFVLPHYKKKTTLQDSTIQIKLSKKSHATTIELGI